MSRRYVLIEALASAPRDLERMLRAVSAEQALQPPTSADWCIADVVAHMGAVEVLFLARLRLVVEEECPTVAFIHPDASAHDLSQTLTALYTTFAARRSETIIFLQGLAQAQWSRKLMYAEYGPSTLRDQVQILVDHDSNHLAQIIALRSRL